MRSEVMVDPESAADHTRMKQAIGTVLPCYTIQLPLGGREDAVSVPSFHPSVSQGPKEAIDLLTKAVPH